MSKSTWPMKKTFHQPMLQSFHTSKTFTFYTYFKKIRASMFHWPNSANVKGGGLW